MFKFFKNLFFPPVQREDGIEVIFDEKEGTIKIISDRKLTDEEVVELAKNKVREVFEGDVEDDD